MALGTFLVWFLPENIKSGGFLFATCSLRLVHGRDSGVVWLAFRDVTHQVGSRLIDPRSDGAALTGASSGRGSPADGRLSL